MSVFLTIPQYFQYETILIILPWNYWLLNLKGESIFHYLFYLSTKYAILIRKVQLAQSKPQTLTISASATTL